MAQSISLHTLPFQNAQHTNNIAAESGSWCETMTKVAIVAATAIATVACFTLLAPVTALIITAVVLLAAGSALNCFSTHSHQPNFVPWYSRPIWYPVTTPIYSSGRGGAYIPPAPPPLGRGHVGVGRGHFSPPPAPGRGHVGVGRGHIPPTPPPVGRGRPPSGNVGVGRGHIHPTR